MPHRRCVPFCHSSSFLPLDHSPLTLIHLLAETEKYAHVTFFFNGGREASFPGETRLMVPSPKVATYDKQPEMNAQGVADKMAEVLKSDEFDFVMCNFAPPDMVSPPSFL